MKRAIIFLGLSFFIACSESTDGDLPNNPELPESPVSEVYTLPVVVHVLHNGEEVGEGTNISDEQIRRQIEILNEDFGRKSGTNGFNDHPDSADAMIQFRLAIKDPDGNPSSGIVRKQLKLDQVPNDVPNFEFEQYAHFSYWSAVNYINIWIAPYPEDAVDVVLGKATGPDTDLEGNHLFQKPLEGGAEGIIINWAHFGTSNVSDKHGLGRTLTHEMGHYLGLLHTWGGGECNTNDFCADTPAVDTQVTSIEPYLGCDGVEVMLGNYMNYTPDHLMNIFTNDQIERMRYVMENSERRTSLLSSPGLIPK